MNNEELNIDVQKLKPFTRFIYTIGVLPTSYLLSMTYEEQLIWLCNYLKETVIPTINNNAQAVEELQTKYIELKSYVDNYFNELNVQEEINNKLDEMAESGELTDIIAQYLGLAGILAYNTISDMVNAENLVNGSVARTLGKSTYNDGKGQFYKIRTITNDDIVDGINIIALNVSNTLIAELIQDTNDYYDILKNGGYDDGTTPNDGIFNTAKTIGYRKFYFSQNSNNNANYYFTNYAFFNDCEVKTDEGVIINFPNISNIDSTKTGKYLTNVIYKSRVQNLNFDTPSNISDYFNHFDMKNYKRKIGSFSIKALNDLKLYLYSYDNTGVYEDADTSKDTCFQEIDYNIRYKANSYTSILTTPLDKDKYQCIEIETTPTTQIYYGWLDSSSGIGVFNDYDGVNPQEYYSVNGTSNPSKITSYIRFGNFWKHYLKNKTSNDFAKSMKYKLKNNPILKQIELYINDIFVCAYPWNSQEPDYFGFGIKNINNISNANGFSYISSYEEEITPINSSLNILLVGDSRTYGYNSQYRIEDVIKCGLISNGINNVNIDNISVSGWNMGDILTALNNENLTDYDIVIVATGINDYNSTYKSILEAIFQINQTITNANCYSIVCATIPSCYDATDPYGDDRAEMYYKIENAIFSGCNYNIRNGFVHYIPNIMGNTNYENLIPMCNDGVHPTSLGTIQFAKAIVNEILTIFN